jgi:hypothetical protein
VVWVTQQVQILSEDLSEDLAGDSCQDPCEALGVEMNSVEPCEGLGGESTWNIS